MDGLKEDDDPYDAPASPAYNVPTPGGSELHKGYLFVCFH